MAIILHRPATAQASEPAQRAGDGAGETSQRLPYTVADDFVIRDKAVPFWAGIKAVLGRPSAHR